MGSSRAPLWRLAPGLALAAALAACGAEPPPAAAPPPGPAPVLSVRELMERVIDPPADVFWDASGTIVTAAGEASRAPTTDAGWDAAVNAAATLVEASALLLLPGRVRAEPEWTRYALELQRTATAGMKAAQARDARAVFDTGGEIFLACRGCHEKYLFGPQ